MQFCTAVALTIAFLLRSCPKLQAAIAGPDSEPCQMCCQAAAGVPGVPGVPGAFGPKGEPGPPGVKGQKGEPGETPEDSSRVAFTMLRRTTFTSTSETTRLPFEETVTLLPGTNIDLATGTFTCHVSGIYVFMFSAPKKSSTSRVYVSLRRNGVIVVTAGSTGSGEREQVANSAVLALQQRDTVYLTMEGRVEDDSSNHYTSFSGFLLHEE